MLEIKEISDPIFTGDDLQEIINHAASIIDNSPLLNTDQKNTCHLCLDDTKYVDAMLGELQQEVKAENLKPLPTLAEELAKKWPSKILELKFKEKK